MTEPTQIASGNGTVLPTDRRTRRLAIATLANRAIAQKRDAQIADVLGADGAYLVADLVAATTSEVAAQLLLSEHLLERGWTWDDVLREVWYREDALRTAARGSEG